MPITSFPEGIRAYLWAGLPAPGSSQVLAFPLALRQSSGFYPLPGHGGGSAPDSPNITSGSPDFPILPFQRAPRESPKKG